MNQFVQNQKDTERCLSTEIIAINENTQHPSYILAANDCNEFVYWLNSIVIIFDHNERRKERVWSEWYFEQSISLR
jgi:hypothetical protein